MPGASLQSLIQSYRLRREYTPADVSFLRYHGAFVSDKLPMIGADSGVEALFESNLSPIKMVLTQLC